MHHTFSDTGRSIVGSVWTTLKRFVMLYRTGGNEDVWTPEYVVSEVTDINTRQPIHGDVMRKIIDGRWAYRAMTAEEFKDHQERTAW